MPIELAPQSVKLCQSRRRQRLASAKPAKRRYKRRSLERCRTVCPAKSRGFATRSLSLPLVRAGFADCVAERVGFEPKVLFVPAKPRNSRHSFSEPAQERQKWARFQRFGKIADFLQNSTVSVIGFETDSPLPKKTETLQVPAWRSGRDSNPRYGFAVYSLSRRAPSTTRPPLRVPGRSAHLGGGSMRGKLAGRTDRATRS